MVEDCEIQREWKLDPRLSSRVATIVNQTELEIGRTVRIISGFRTDREQLALKQAGRPAAPVHLSNHTVCPSRAVDVSLGFLPTRVQKAIFGRISVMNGLRWGGGGPVDDGGIPIDWQHIDLGPRQSV